MSAAHMKKQHVVLEERESHGTALISHNIKIAKKQTCSLVIHVFSQYQTQPQWKSNQTTQNICVVCVSSITHLPTSKNPVHSTPSLNLQLTPSPEICFFSYMCVIYPWMCLFIFYLSIICAFLPRQDERINTTIMILCEL